MVNYEEGDIVRYYRTERKLVAEGPLVKSFGDADNLYPKGRTALPFVRVAGTGSWTDYEVELVEKANVTPKFKVGDWVKTNGLAPFKVEPFQITGVTEGRHKDGGSRWYSGDPNGWGVWENYLELTEEPNYTFENLTNLPRGSVFSWEKGDTLYVRTLKGAKALNGLKIDYPLEDFSGWTSLHVEYNPEES